MDKRLYFVCFFPAKAFQYSNGQANEFFGGIPSRRFHFLEVRIIFILVGFAVFELGGRLSLRVWFSAHYPFLISRSPLFYIGSTSIFPLILLWSALFKKADTCFP